MAYDYESVGNVLVIYCTVIGLWFQNHQSYNRRTTSPTKSEVQPSHISILVIVGTVSFESLLAKTNVTRNQYAIKRLNKAWFDGMLIRDWQQTSAH